MASSAACSHAGISSQEHFPHVRSARAECATFRSDKEASCPLRRRRRRAQKTSGKDEIFQLERDQRLRAETAAAQPPPVVVAHYSPELSVDYTNGIGLHIACQKMCSSRLVCCEEFKAKFIKGRHCSDWEIPSLFRFFPPTTSCYQKLPSFEAAIYYCLALSKSQRLFFTSFILVSRIRISTTRKKKQSTQINILRHEL